jgi:hypothetical protein
LLIKATDYIERKWVFKGVREFEDQALSFPRLRLWDNEGDEVAGVPNKLKWAVSEYALLANSGELFLTPSTDTSGLQVQRLREKIGPIETETAFVGGSQTIVKNFPNADNLLRDYVIPGGQVIRN